MLAVWQAMSPMAPVPKSYQPRQLNGWYVPLTNGRIGAPAMNWSQWTVSGQTSAWSGRAVILGAWGQIGRLVQTWTSLTSPMIPDWTSSTALRRPFSADPWFPIWVQTLYLRAASLST